MAIIDQERGVIIVRAVYDGPPFSGKTTSVQALNTILGKTSNLFSPGEEAGRTHYFDWMEYTGGYFKGYGILCQIISVPGQLSLQERRHFLLKSADVVVFVIDSAETHIALNYFNDLQTYLAQPDEPTKVIVQANKQDGASALTAEQIKQVFKDYPDVKIIETTATLAKGVRETFVLAVRLAIERANALMSKGKLLLGKPEINSGEELLARLQQHDAAVVTPVEETLVALPEVVADDELLAEESPEPIELSEADYYTAQMLTEFEQVFESEREVPIEPSLKSETKLPHQKLPKLPDEEVSIHWIWPPFMGQKMLKELFKHALRPRLQADGTWFIEVPAQWRCFSKPRWCYPDSEQARHALRHHISRHLQCSRILAEQRCIAVVAESDNVWRLWQILSAGPTLLAELTQILTTGNPNEIALQLYQNATEFGKAYQYCPFMADLTLASFGLQQQQLTYLGSIDEITADRESLATVLKRTYTPIFQNITEKAIIINELQKIAQEPSVITETLIELLNE
jgi:signal recognition particle receptor subunit beta